jgi:transcriptional regulator with XRE-family HTH domain
MAPSAKSRLFDAKVGHRLRRARVENGLTLMEVADQLGVSYQQVQKYELGKNVLTLRKFLALATILKRDPHTFWSGSYPGDRSPHPSRSMDANLIEFVKAFKRIRNPAVKKELYGLAKQLADAAD